MEPTSPKTRKRSRFVILAVLVVVLASAGWYFARSTAENSAAAAQAGGASNSQPPSDAENRIMAGIVQETRLWKGNSEAPVTIVEFADFQ